MTHAARIITLLIGTMFLSLVTSTTLHAQQAAPGTPQASDQVARGKKNFVTYLCYSCHGYAAHGGTDTGPRLDANKLSYDAFSKYVRKPGGSMPPYGNAKHLPDAALQEIYAYVKSLPAPPDPKTIPLLND
jgi:mono/diheme cytochrome c family protein